MPDHAFARDSVGPGNDVKVPSRLHGGRDLRRHIDGIGELLVLEMPALLRQQLILDVHRGCAAILETAHHVHDVEHFAIAGVAVDQQRQISRAADLSDEETDLLDREDAEVRQAHGCAHGGTGEIESLETGCFRLQRCQAVMGPRKLQDFVAIEELAKTLSRR